MGVEHEASEWCWCRPRVVNQVYAMTVVHRDIEPPHWMAQRRFAGGEAYDGSGCAAAWRQLYP